jgi:hypothetical protein
MQNIHNANLNSNTNTTLYPAGQAVTGGPFLVQGAPVVYSQPQAVGVTPVVVQQVPVQPVVHNVDPTLAQDMTGNGMLTNVAARGEIFRRNRLESLIPRKK